MNGFGNFTARAQRAIQLAAREADRFATWAEVRYLSSPSPGETGP